MQNKLERNLTDLAAQGHKIANGAAEYAATLDLGINAASNISLDVTALRDAIATATHERVELSNRRGIVRALVETSRTWLTATRDSFKPLLGFSHNLRWAETGLARSLIISEEDDEVAALLRSFKAYLTDHPDLELPSRQITAAHAEDLTEQLQAAMGNVLAKETTVRTMMNDRDQKAKKVRLRLRGTINTLKQLLDPMDPRWLAFGLNCPGAQARPDVPEKVEVIAVSETEMQVTWDPTPRADSYHVWTKEIGSNEEPKLTAARAEADVIIAIPASKVPIEVSVSAVNKGGESARSGVVQAKV